MTVTVVPALRLRRATTGWSYRVPTGMQLQAGALVIVPFRGHPHLGVVWDTEDNPKATLTVTEALTTTPLVRAPHRGLIEWMSEAGLCSLSTALYTWLPAALRKLPLTRPVREALASWDATQPTARSIALAKQHAVLTPSIREQAEAQLKARYGAAFRSTFSDTTPAQEFATWLAIAQGACHVAVGREQTLFAPWVNLRHCTVIEPEDISYHTGQSPRLSLVDGAAQLAQLSSAAFDARSNVPLAAAHIVWSKASSLPLPETHAELTDLRREPLLNPRLLEAISSSIRSSKHVVILYNAHDRLRQEDDGTRTVIPGVETVRKRLVAALGSDSPYLHIGTRRILENLPRPIGLTAVLSLDPLLGVTTVTDQLHGWGDLGKLLRTGAPLIVQTHQPEHELAQALQNGTLATYCAHELESAKAAGVPPFTDVIACALPANRSSGVSPAELAAQLTEARGELWRVGHPREVTIRKQIHTIITLHGPHAARIPLSLKTILAALPRPWIVERNPWYSV